MKKEFVRSLLVAGLFGAFVVAAPRGAQANEALFEENVAEAEGALSESEENVAEAEDALESQYWRRHDRRGDRWDRRDDRWDRRDDRWDRRDDRWDRRHRRHRRHGGWGWGW